jgi:hypothetical protein
LFVCFESHEQFLSYLATAPLPVTGLLNCSHHGPRGSGGATIGKTIFSYVYIEKNLPLQNQQANFNQSWYKSFLGKVQIKGQFLFKGKIITTFKNLFIKNHRAGIVQIYMKDF